MDEGTETNTLLPFLAMSLRGTNREIGTRRSKSTLIVHARVPIPRKGSAHRNFYANNGVFFSDIMLFSACTLMKYSHSAATPTAHPRRVQKSTRNEICLTASEILLRKVKSDKSDEISLREVTVKKQINKYTTSWRLTNNWLLPLIGNNRRDK